MDESNRGLEKTFKEIVHKEHKEGKDVNWKSFKDGIRIHQAGTAWAAAVAEGANIRPRITSVRAPHKHPALGDEQDEAVAALLKQRPPPSKEQPIKKMSLMALLADGGRYSDDDDDDDYDAGVGQDDDEEEGENEGDMVHTCCMCLVRHKGAAFIPCGHTFCRLCSRELWVSRGNCPLCNGFVLEILDIF